MIWKGATSRCDVWMIAGLDASRIPVRMHFHAIACMTRKSYNGVRRLMRDIQARNLIRCRTGCYSAVAIRLGLVH
jgi:hypothetical protein